MKSILRPNRDLNVCLAFSVFATFGLGCESSAQEIVSSGPENLSITVYNQNFGLVKEQRNVDLKSGINFIRVEDVAAQIDPTTVSFESLTHPNAVVVREQNYQYDLIDPTTVLSKSIGKTLKFKQFLAGGRVNELTGVLLNAPRNTVVSTDGSSSEAVSGLVIKTADSVILNPEGQVELKELPQGLVGKPSLLWKLESGEPGLHKTEICYQTGGLNWNCDYVAVLNKDDNASDLTSWVTIDNKSGATYKDTALKLIAGDVHQVQPQAMPMMAEAATDAMVASAPPPPQFKEESFSEYHLYSLQGKSTVANNETKQLSLFNASNIPVKKLFIYEPNSGEFNRGNGSAADKVNVKIEILNSKANHLGMPMPKGKVRVYKKDSDGALQFVGEDQIEHTPKDEKIRLYIGDAFDLVAEKKQISFRQVSSNLHRASYEISLRNHKKEEQTITCIEHSWGDWTLLNSSQSYTKTDAKTFEFVVKVPANGEVKLNYEIETRY